MERRWLTFSVVVMLLTFMVGFRVSYVQGIQPGYFEKKEAPAYGVGGGTAAVEGIDQDTQEYFNNLYKDDDE